VTLEKVGPVYESSFVDNVEREAAYLQRHPAVTIVDRNVQPKPFWRGIYRAVIQGSGDAEATEVKGNDLGSLLDALIKVTGW
jgi:hypothetical protein